MQLSVLLGLALPSDFHHDRAEHLAFFLQRLSEEGNGLRELPLAPKHHREIVYHAQRVGVSSAEHTALHREWFLDERSGLRKFPLLSANALSQR